MDTNAQNRLPENDPQRRKGAIGKALLVWLFSGSLGLAVIALIIFAAIGC